MIPKFASNWVKKTSVTGKLSSPSEPGVALQDGPKLPLLCGECEQLLGVDEKKFAERVFFPRHEDGDWLGFDYQDWLLRFAVGLGLRAVLVTGPESADDAGTRAVLDVALPAWRRFLLGKMPTTGGFASHLIMTDYLDPTTGPVAENIQWYLMRGADLTFVRSRSGRASVFSMLPGFVFWTPIRPRKMTGWHGTRIKLRGRFDWEGRTVVAEGKLFDFLNDRARMVQELAAGNDRQQAARDRRFLRNSGRIAGSRSTDAFLATQALRHAGTLE